MKFGKTEQLVLGISLVAILAVLGIGAAFLILSGANRTFRYAVPQSEPIPVADFTLTTANGEKHSLNEFRGKVVLLFFGYTHCPDVCPMTLTHLQNAMQSLGPASKDVQVLMVTVDPERDTPERMAKYVRAFDPRFIGLSGTPGEIAGLAQRTGIFYQHAAPDVSGNYAVEHYAGVLTLDRQGRLRGIFPFGVTGEQFAQDLQVVLR